MKKLLAIAVVAALSASLSGCFWGPGPGWGGGDHGHGGPGGGGPGGGDGPHGAIVVPDQVAQA